MSLSTNHCFYMSTAQLTHTGDPNIGFIYLFQVQIAMNVQHPGLLAQARQKPPLSWPAQDDLQSQVSSKHSRDKAISSNPCGNTTLCCLCPFLRKNCHQLDNSHSWPHVATDTKNKALSYITYIYLICHLVTSVLSLSIKPMEHRQQMAQLFSLSHGLMNV